MAHPHLVGEGLGRRVFLLSHDLQNAQLRRGHPRGLRQIARIEFGGPQNAAQSDQTFVDPVGMFLRHGASLHIGGILSNRSKPA